LNSNLTSTPMPTSTPKWHPHARFFGFCSHAYFVIAPLVHHSVHPGELYT